MDRVGQGDNGSLRCGFEIPAEPLGLLLLLVLVEVVGFGVGGPLGGVVAVVDGVDIVQPVLEVAGDWDSERLRRHVRVGFGFGFGVDEGCLACDFGIAAYAADEGFQVDCLWHLILMEDELG